MQSIGGDARWADMIDDEDDAPPPCVASYGTVAPPRPSGSTTADTGSWIRVKEQRQKSVPLQHPRRHKKPPKQRTTVDDDGWTTVQKRR